MATFAARWEPPEGTGPTVAVKDLIDVAGTPTTCSSAAVADGARPAAHDAACVARIRANGGRIVGKTNLHELAFGGSGINPWTGTPVNPLDATRIPGGSSSGSAVAVATGEVDIAYGTDTGGSVRTPAACCGIVGLKTTFGRVPLTGVYPLSPSMDTIGPMARTVAGVVDGMRLLEADFAPRPVGRLALGRFRLPGTHPAIDAAIDAALDVGVALGDATDGAHGPGGLAVRQIELPGWLDADAAGSTVVFAEAAIVNRRLLRDHRDRLGDETLERLERGRAIAAPTLAAARAAGRVWRAELDAALADTPVVVTSAILDEPPPLTDPARLDTRRPNVAVNLSGHPALVLPVPRDGGLPTSLQLIAGHGEEQLLVAVGAAIEAALAR